MSSVRDSLASKIAAAEAALETSLANNASEAELLQHDKVLQALDRLFSRFPVRKPPNWLFSLSAVVIAVSLLGIAAAIQLPTPLVTVDARISSLTVTAAPGSSGIQSDVPILLKSLEVVGDKEASAIAALAASVSSIELIAGTTALLEQSDSCLMVGIPVEQDASQGDRAMGLHLVILHPPEATGQLPTPMDLRVSPGMTLTMCGELPPNYALAGSVSNVKFYRQQPGDAVKGFANTRTPSIRSGKLRLPAVNRTSELQDTDML